MKYQFGKLMFCFIGMFLWTSSVALAQDEDVKGSNDHPLIGRFLGSRIIGYDHRDYNEFTIALGPQTRDENDKIILKKSKHLEGKITRILYLTPKGSSTLQVFRNYEKAIKKDAFELLFSCFSGDCGTLIQYTPTLSNELYEYTLSGHFKDQRYLSARRPMNEGDVFVSLFVFEHTSPHGSLQGRVLVQLDVIESEDLEPDKIANAHTMETGIVEKGRVALYGIFFDNDKTDIKSESQPMLKEIAQLLQKSPNLKVYVVGHTDNVGDPSYNMNLSKGRAEAVVQVLISQYGIPSNRLKPMGVGVYAPLASNDTPEGRAKNRRVELVKQ